MKYQVEVSESAHRDLEAIVVWIAQHSEAAAYQWYSRVREAIDSLVQSPKRCSLAPENKSFEEEIRHLLHGRSPNVYRILFMIQDRSVIVLHVRHGAQVPLKRG